MRRTAAALLPVAVALLAAAWACGALLLPPPRHPFASTPSVPPVGSLRVTLRDGRHLAYREWGVPKTQARHRVILVHGFASSKNFSLSASPELVKELGAYFVSYDRAGYGESDPYPGRMVKSEALDIQDLADQLGLGDRFHVIGLSWGGLPAWSCIKHIPHRLAGVALVAPAINFWWPSLPTNLSTAAYARLQPSDQLAFGIARHAPRLFDAYMDQKPGTPSAIVAGDPVTLSRQDKEIRRRPAANSTTSVQNTAGRQGVHESVYRDIKVVFGDWGFEPMDLLNPLPQNEATVRIWQGREDRIVDAEVQRYVAGKLPWVRYHECSDCGHLFVLMESWSNAILKGLLL